MLGTKYSLRGEPERERHNSESLGEFLSGYRSCSAFSFTADCEYACVLYISHLFNFKSNELLKSLVVYKRLLTRNDDESSRKFKGIIEIVEGIL